MRLRDRVAIVTGGGTGIGRAIAHRFAAEGAVVVVAGRREAPLVETAQSIAAAGGRAHAVAADVARADGAAALVAAALERAGRIDVLVNNAGRVVARGPLAELDDADLARTLDANLVPTFRATRAALPALVRARGAIVNIGSTAGLKGSPALGAYAAAKAAVVNLTKTLALELAPSGVRVNAICPAYIETDMNRAFLAGLRPSGAYDALVRMHPLGLGTPDDVAWAAVYLASPEARWITGVALPLDGGLTAGL